MSPQPFAPPEAMRETVTGWVPTALPSTTTGSTSATARSSVHRLSGAPAGSTSAGHSVNFAKLRRYAAVFTGVWVSWADNVDAATKTPAENTTSTAGARL